MAELEHKAGDSNVIFKIPLAFLITVVDYERIKEDLQCENVENVMNKNGLANGVDYKKFGKTIDSNHNLITMLQKFNGTELKTKTVSAIDNVIHWNLYSSVHDHDPDETKEDELSGDEKPETIKIKNGYNVDLCKADCLKTVKHFTKKNGAIYALLNMANKEFIGGHYESGFIAQEETIWNRTSCHFSVKDSDRKQDEPNKYTEELSQLINCNDSIKSDEVYLDMDWPRTCILKSDKTYLSQENYFPFWELRSAAEDLSKGNYTDNEHQITYTKINAQFNTLKKKGVKHVVLGAFGCGEFNNYAPAVAQIYRNLIIKYYKYFDHIAFAIQQDPKKNNEAIFKKVLEGIKFVLPIPLPTTDAELLKKNYIKFLFIELMNTASQYYDNTNYDKKNYVKYYRDIYETSLVGGNYFDKYVHNKKNYENITKLFYYEMYKTNKLLYEKLY